MRSSLLKASGLGVLIAAVMFACSSADGPKTAAGSVSGAGGASASSGAGQGGFIVLVGSGGGASSVDAGVEDAWISDGGYFDCKGCACPSATHYCETTLGGAPLPPFPPFPPPTPPQPGDPKCDEVDGYTSCAPIPDQCLSALTCSCIEPYPFCDCSNDGTGFYVTCAFP